MTEWDKNRAAMREHLATDTLADFLNWSTIQKTMFVGDVGYVHDMLKEILADSFKLTNNGEYKISNILAETPTGNPTLFQGWTSGSLIVQLYHLKQWLDRSSKAVGQLSSIIEVGAGYGAMALIIYRLGFKGRYTIFDLPEMAQIQQYYLSRTLPNDLSHIFWLNTLPSSPLSCDLFIGCHSLSEMPVDERERLLAQVDADAYLFASSYEFEGVDNDVWFREFGKSEPGYRWEQWAHPYYENAFYSVGVKL
jgi:hypothetical protein